VVVGGPVPPGGLVVGGPGPPDGLLTRRRVAMFAWRCY